MSTVDIQAGQLVADCRLVRLLGSGGEGQVWEATRQDGSTCAMKLVLPEVLPSPEEVRDRGRWLVRINHPAMVTVTRGGRFTGGDLKDWGFVEMELVKGTSMQQAPPDPKALDHLAGVGEALDLLHQGVWSDGVPLVHRDVKPGNLIATDRGLVLVDPSTLRGVDTRDLTRVGTPAYVAPEVATGVFGTNVDVYSFAATAAALLTGLRGGELRKLVDAPIGSGLPEGIVAGLHIDPRKRPETCAEVVSGKILVRKPRPVPEGSTRIGRGTLVPPEQQPTAANQTAVSPTRQAPPTRRGDPATRTAIAAPTQANPRPYVRPQTRQPAGLAEAPSGGFGTQHLFNRQERLPARRPIEVAASSGQDWEGASRVTPVDRDYGAPLRAWPVLCLFICLMALAIGWYGQYDPSLNLGPKEFNAILLVVGAFHVLLHLFNRRPILGILLPTYAWGAALGDTSGTRRYGWVMDVCSGWLTTWGLGVGAYIYAKMGLTSWLSTTSPFSGWLDVIATIDVPPWAWVIVALVVWMGVLIIRGLGRAFAPFHFIGALFNLPFRLIGGFPRWIFRW